MVEFQKIYTSGKLSLLIDFYVLLYLPYLIIPFTIDLLIQDKTISWHMICFITFFYQTMTLHFKWKIKKNIGRNTTCNTLEMDINKCIEIQYPFHLRIK